MDIQNPYWEIVDTLPRDELYPFNANAPRSIESYPRIRAYDRYSGETRTLEELEALPDRTSLTRQYAWSLTPPASVDFVLEHLDGRPVVEVGAGTGYWAWLLTQAGIDVNAYDSDPPSKGRNNWHAPRSKIWHEYTEEERRKYRERTEGLVRTTAELKELTKDSEHPYLPELSTELPQGDWTEGPDGTPGNEFVPVLQGGSEVLELPENRTRVLFLSWPPYDNDMGAEVVRAYQGDTIIYLGEREGGCCGSDTMFQLLDEGWEGVARCSQHVQWSGIHDHLMTYKRKGPDG